MDSAVATVERFLVSASDWNALVAHIGPPDFDFRMSEPIWAKCHSDFYMNVFRATYLRKFLQPMDKVNLFAVVRSVYDICVPTNEPGQRISEILALAPQEEQSAATRRQRKMQITDIGYLAPLYYEGKLVNYGEMVDSFLKSVAAHAFNNHGTLFDDYPQSLRESFPLILAQWNVAAEKYVTVVDKWIRSLYLSDVEWYRAFRAAGGHMPRPRRDVVGLAQRVSAATAYTARRPDGTDSGIKQRDMATRYLAGRPELFMEGQDPREWTTGGKSPGLTVRFRTQDTEGGLVRYADYEANDDGVTPQTVFDWYERRRQSPPVRGGGVETKIVKLSPPPTRGHDVL